VKEPGPLLASGRTADVFEYGPKLVLRRYRPPFTTQREAEIMDYARAHGFPVPAVHDVTDSDIVMERVNGPTMIDDFARRPWTLVAHAHLLAELHERLHAIVAPPWLAAPFGEGACLLHLDLHPLNVIITRDGPIVIDWPSAARGPWTADVAHSWVVMATAVPPGGAPRQLLVRAARRVFLRRFLSHFDRAEVLELLPPVAAQWVRNRNTQESERATVPLFLSQLGLALDAPPRDPPPAATESPTTPG
jgi:aminoglycoside phosphotransferase (APT) family kinase protein